MITKLAHTLIEKEASIAGAFGKIINPIKNMLTKTPPVNQGKALAEVAPQAVKKPQTFGQKLKRGAIVGGIGAGIGGVATYNSFSDQLNQNYQNQPAPQHFQHLPQPNFYR